MVVVFLSSLNLSFFSLSCFFLTCDFKILVAFSLMKMENTMLSIESGRPLESTNVSHLQLWQDSVTARPNATALISRHQDPKTFRWVGSQNVDQDHVEWTFIDLDRGARRLATALNRLTHVERRPIAVLFNTTAEWALFLWAAAYLHAPLVPINPKCASRSEEILHMLELTRPAVLVTGDTVIAGQLESSLSLDALAMIPVKLTLDDQMERLDAPGQWTSLSTIMYGDRSPPDTPDVFEAKDTALVLFTSGTTSLPKPCNLSSFMCVNAALGYMEARQINSTHRFVQHLPNFHSYGIGWSLGFWFMGGSVIFPSSSFEPQASLECFDLFQATHMSLVPTTAQATVNHPYFAKANLQSLVSIDVSGAGVLPSVIQMCNDNLRKSCGTSYGMTESPGTLVWPESGGPVVRDGEVLSGRPVRGTSVKVCQPGTQEVVPRGEIGELHNGGVQVIQGYADPSVPSDNFYMDEKGVQWIMTGDQAVMEADGAVRISGRYKDMIIRGGENISPASIEDYLRKREGVLAAEVVGVPDEMAGEVPIAIITTREGAAVAASYLKDATSRDLGPAFAPKMIIRLDELGLTGWPTTASGKVRKVELRAIVREYVQERKNAAVDSSAPTVESLMKIWELISGADTLTPKSIIQSFADSLMMMQLSGMVKRELRHDVTVEQFKLCETIQDQADLVDACPEKVARIQEHTRPGPPALEDIPYMGNDNEMYQTTKASVASMLDHVGLKWNDVEDVMPLPGWDALFCHRSRPMSWNLRFSYHAPVDSARLEKAVKEVMSYHPTLRSLALVNEGAEPLLVSIRNSDGWQRASLTSGWEVETKEDLKTLLLDDLVLDCATQPGPLVRIHIASVRSDGTSGLVFVGSHAVHDMSMTKLWLEDLTTVLSGEGLLTQHVPFKDYANAYYRHRNGAAADKGVQFWTSKLQGISSVPESTLWPEQRAPEWFKGADDGWSRWCGRKAREGERTVCSSQKLRAQKGIRRMAKVQNLARLKAEHDVPVFMLVKAAIALLNIQQTGGKEAIFGTINAARTWPFREDYNASEREMWRGNPLDISGCTTEYVLDRIPVSKHRSVLDFMQRVTKDEEQNSAFAHTPFGRIVDRLRDPLFGDDVRTWAERDRDAESLLPLIRRQSFNWLPSAPNAGTSPTSLHMLEMLTRMDNGLTITGFLADDKRSVALSFTWDAEHLSMSEAERALDVLVSLIERMGDEQSWGSTVGELLRN